MCRSQHAACETPPVCKVVFRLLLEEGDALCLVAGDAMEPPREDRHPFCQDQLQVPFRREAIEHAIPVLLPVLSLLDPGDDRGGGAYAVASGVPAHHLLAPFCPGTSASCRPCECGPCPRPWCPSSP